MQVKGIQSPHHLFPQLPKMLITIMYNNNAGIVHVAMAITWPVQVWPYLL